MLSTDMGMGGGAEEQVIALACGLRRRGWAASIVSMVPPSPMPPGFEDEGVPLAHLGMRRSVPDPRAVFRLAGLIGEFRPDVVHSHMVHANLLARAARLVQPFRVLVSTHHSATMTGVDRDWSPLFEIAHRLSDRLCDRSTAICRPAADYYVRRRAVPASKIEVVPNGIDSGRFRHDPDARERLQCVLRLAGQFVWLAVGRLERQKAYHVLLRAFACLGDGPRTLLICGEGSRREELGALAAELGVSDRVRFLGLRTDVPSLLSAADAFALSSDLEGLPLVLLQASAAGLPIVATDVGGNAEVVEDGVSGYLAPAGDPTAFARLMAHVEALHAEDRTAMGRAGRARVGALFEAERVVARWEQIYANLLDARGSDHAA